MITRTQAFVTSDNQTFLTLEAAQGHELSQLWLGDKTQAQQGEGVPAWIFKNREKIMDILTTTPTSKPRARRVNGGTKKRTKSVADINASANLELAAAAK